MKLGTRMLRFLFKADEDQRMELRRRMATSSAHTEDLNRTVMLDAEAIRTAVQRFRTANDPQQVVQFDTLAPICKDKGPSIAGTQMCSHEKAGPGQRCEQQTCPVIVGRTQEAQREVA
jgi:hypothetical protein